MTATHFNANDRPACRRGGQGPRLTTNAHATDCVACRRTAAYRAERARLDALHPRASYPVGTRLRGYRSTCVIVSADERGAALRWEDGKIGTTDHRTVLARFEVLRA